MPKLRPLSETRFINDANLISYWKMDGNSNDSKGSNNGVDTGITYTTGLYGQCAASAGGSTNRKIAIPSSTSLISPANTLTISIWCYLDALVVQTVPILMRITPDAPPYNCYVFELNPSGTRSIVWSVTTGSGTVELTNANTLSTGSWHHLVGTYDGSYIKLYVNGKYAGQAAQTGNINYASGRELRIADNIYGAGQFYNGKVDDVALFNRAITAEEVAEIYSAGMNFGEYLGDVTTETELYNSDLFNDSSLIAYYRMEGNANDSKGTNNGTATNVTYGVGKFGNAATFNGSSSKIDVGTGISLTGNYTLSAWVKPNASITNEKIIIKDKTGVNYAQFYIDIVNNKAQVGSQGANAPTPSAVIASTSNIPTGVWTHIVGTRDGSYINIYINGNFENRVAWSTAQFASTDSVTIGCTKNSSGTPAYVFNGSIDDVSIFSRALSATEIAQLYKAGSTKLLLHLNGNSADSSGNNNHGTDTAITYVNGKFGKCASFNGSSSKIFHPSEAYVSATAYTLSAWINTSQTGTGVAQILASDKVNATANRKWQLGLEKDNGKIRFIRFDASQNLATYFISSSVVNNGNWHHILATFDSSVGSKLYIDGKYENGDTVTTANNVTSGQVTLGSNTDSTELFNGLIAEVIVENIAWTPQEVAKYYAYVKGRYATL